MEFSESEWAGLLARMADQLGIVEAWRAAEPNPSAQRCSQSRHRTLGHLRAAQETWLDAVRHFSAKEGSNLKRLHPLRLFDQMGYDLAPWDDHLEQFRRDREEWLDIVSSPTLDRNRGGKLSGRAETIASLTHRLVTHEARHIAELREQ